MTNVYAGAAFGGSYTATPNGRWTANFIPTSGALINMNLVGWQISPTRSTVMVTSATNSNVSNYQILSTGTMLAQTLGLSDPSVSGNYAQTFGGFISGNGNVESTGNYLANGSGGLSGTVDFQEDTGGLTVDSSQSGTYSVDPTLGRSIVGSITGVPVYVYTVDPNTLYVISSTSADALQGTLLKQTP